MEWNDAKFRYEKFFNLVKYRPVGCPLETNCLPCSVWICVFLREERDACYVLKGGWQLASANSGLCYRCSKFVFLYVVPSILESESWVPVLEFGLKRGIGGIKGKANASEVTLKKRLIKQWQKSLPLESFSTAIPQIYLCNASHMMSLTRESKHWNKSRTWLKHPSVSPNRAGWRELPKQSQQGCDWFRAGRSSLLFSSSWMVFEGEEGSSSIKSFLA